MTEICTIFIFWLVQGYYLTVTNLKMAVSQPFIVRLTRELHRWIRKSTRNICLIMSKTFFQDGGLEKTQILSPFPGNVKYWNFKIAKIRVRVQASRKGRLLRNRSRNGGDMQDFHILACSRLLLKSQILKWLYLSHLWSDWLADFIGWIRKIRSVSQIFFENYFARWRTKFQTVISRSFINQFSRDSHR